MRVTIPVDDLPGLREFAAGWLGRDPKQDWGILALHIPAGFDLGLLYAHHMGYRWAPCFSWPGRSFPMLAHVGQLMGHAGDGLVEELANIAAANPVGVRGDLTPEAPSLALKACLLFSAR